MARLQDICSILLKLNFEHCYFFSFSFNSIRSKTLKTTNWHQELVGQEGLSMRDVTKPQKTKTCSKNVITCQQHHELDHSNIIFYTLCFFYKNVEKCSRFERSII